jgi:hypothetical protein
MTERGWLLIYEDGSTEKIHAQNEYILADELYKKQNVNQIEYIFSIKAANIARKRARKCKDVRNKILYKK